MSKSVQSVYRYPILVEGRGSLGRTDALTQTDLLVSHDIKMGGAKRLRLELNVLNLFDSNTATSRFPTETAASRGASVAITEEQFFRGFDMHLDAATSSGDTRPSTWNVG